MSHLFTRGQLEDMLQKTHKKKESALSDQQKLILSNTEFFRNAKRAALDFSIPTVAFVFLLCLNVANGANVSVPIIVLCGLGIVWMLRFLLFSLALAFSKQGIGSFIYTFTILVMFIVLLCLNGIATPIPAIVICIVGIVWTLIPAFLYLYNYVCFKLVLNDYKNIVSMFDEKIQMYQHKLNSGDFYEGDNDFEN